MDEFKSISYRAVTLALSLIYLEVQEQCPGMKRIFYFYLALTVLLLGILLLLSLNSFIVRCCSNLLSLSLSLINLPHRQMHIELKTNKLNLKLNMH